MTRVGPFGAAAGVLYRLDGDRREPLVALPGAGPAPDTLGVEAGWVGTLGEPHFRKLVLSPDSEWVAWEAEDGGVRVGVAGPAEPPIGVLARWRNAAPDRILWAPIGRYLAIVLVHPGARRSVEVYDVHTAKRLEMPWEAECATVDGCDASHVAWLGGTLLNVEIRLGPDEIAVPFEVNVGVPRSGPAEET